MVEKQAVSSIAGRGIKWNNPSNRDLGKPGRFTFGPVISLSVIDTENKLPQINNTCIRLFIATLFVTVEVGDCPNVYQQSPDCRAEHPHNGILCSALKHRQ